MGVIRPEVIASQKRSGTFLDYLAQANQSISQLGNFLNQQKALQLQERQQFEDERAQGVLENFKIMQELAKNKDGGFLQLAQETPSLITSTFKRMGYTDEQVAQALHEIQQQKLDLGALVNIGIKTYDDGQSQGLRPAEALRKSQQVMQTNFLTQANRELPIQSQRKITDADFYTPKTPTQKTVPNPAGTAMQGGETAPKSQKISDKDFTSANTPAPSLTLDLNKLPPSNAEQAKSLELARQLGQTEFVKQKMAETAPTTSRPAPTPQPEPINVPPATRIESQANIVQPAFPAVPATPAQLSSTSQPSAPEGGVVSQTLEPSFGLSETQAPINIFEGFDVTKIPEKDMKSFQTIQDWFNNPNDKTAKYKGKLVANKLAHVYGTTQMQSRIRKDAQRVIKNLGGLKEAIKFANPAYVNAKANKENADSLARYRAFLETVQKDANSGQANNSVALIAKFTEDQLKTFNQRISTLAKIKDLEQRKAAVKALFNDDEPTYAFVKAYAARNKIDLDKWKNQLLDAKKEGFFLRLWHTIFPEKESQEVPTNPLSSSGLSEAGQQYLNELGVQ